MSQKFIDRETAFPVFIFKGQGDFIAETPVLDLAAQGETEQEAIESLKDMIVDWMSDPHTDKPNIKSVVNMEVGIKIIPIQL